MRYALHCLVITCLSRSDEVPAAVSRVNGVFAFEIKLGAVILEIPV